MGVSSSPASFESPSPFLSTNIRAVTKPLVLQSTISVATISSLGKRIRSGRNTLCVLGQRVAVR